MTSTDAVAAQTLAGLREQQARVDAAEVAKLAMQLEGPNSAIEAMLAAEPAVPKTPSRPANDIAGASPVAEGGGTLAERIRALQSHASRARQQGA